jgi:hypothetical protein
MKTYGKETTHKAKLNDSWKRNSFQIYLHVLWLQQDNTSHYNVKASAQTLKNGRIPIFNDINLRFHHQN